MLSKYFEQGTGEQIMGKRFISVAAKAGWRGGETKTMLMGVESAVNSSWKVTALERWRRSKAAEATSGKNSRLVAPLGEEIHSLFQTSVRKVEKALAARDFDGNASE